jgi:uncharacterized protein YbcI
MRSLILVNFRNIYLFIFAAGTIMAEPISLTLEQLQQEIVQQVVALYRTHLGHELLQISCDIVDKTVTILAKDSITPLERFLEQNQKQDLALQVRSNLLKSLEPYLQSLIEKATNVQVIDVICNSTIETGHTSIVALLAAVPNVSGVDAGRRIKQRLKSDSNSSSG